uniref:Solute carrier family 3 member 2 N-terminal domain-containing protein n=1 Tax=Scophthalmus maximus TaxID=52904 RepID=A0A8D3E0Z8_SCOMX
MEPAEETDSMVCPGMSQLLTSAQQQLDQTPPPACLTEPEMTLTHPCLTVSADGQDAWQPLTKEQLEVAAGGPRWRRLRCYLVLLFWLAWLAMLATSVAIIATSPRPVVTPLEWWQKTLLYELPPAAFRAEEGPGGIDGEAIDDGMIIHNMNVYLNDLCTAPVEAHAHVKNYTLPFSSTLK